MCMFYSIIMFTIYQKPKIYNMSKYLLFVIYEFDFYIKTTSWIVSQPVRLYITFHVGTYFIIVKRY